MLNQLLWTLLSGYLNLGLAVGLICGALLLLRPLLKRVLSPRQRLLLWMTAWFSAYTLQGYQLLSYLHVLPVTFRDLITPRTMENLSFDRVPAYFPDCQWDQQINLALPGGFYVPLSLEPWMAPLAGAVLLGGVVLLTLYFCRRSEGIKAQASQGRLLDWDGPELKPFYGLKPAGDYVLVRLCKGLPTSFVYQKAEKFDGIKYNMIYLQEGLPPERMGMVLRHELNHLKRNHTWMKGIITCGLVLHWWNPLIWLAYKYTCLDLEMDCDRFTLEQLSPPKLPGVRQDPGGAGGGKTDLGRPPGLRGERRGGPGEGRRDLEEADHLRAGGLETKKFLAPAAQLPPVSSAPAVLRGRPLQCGPPGGCRHPNHPAVRQPRKFPPAGAGPARAPELRHGPAGVAQLPTGPVL